LVVKKTVAGIFAGGGKSPESLEEERIPQNSSGWQIGSSEQESPPQTPQTRLPYDEGATAIAGTLMPQGARTSGKPYCEP